MLDNAQMAASTGKSLKSSTFNDKNEKVLQQNLLIRESLEIRKEGTPTGSGLNDPHLCVGSNAWDPLLQKLKDT